MLFRSPPAANDPDDRRAHTTAQRISEIHDHLRAEMGLTQDCQAGNADENRLPAPRFLPGDRVWLNARITTRRPSWKLDHCRLGPFEVVANAHLQTPYAVCHEGARRPE